jgi:predicted ATP-dependent endonuclease of OLD family
MQIETFRIWKYRNIQDSGEIPVEKLSCIVGKNQSGKTALLRALHKFNPYDPDPYDIRREWPRGERRNQNLNQVVCEVYFRLDKQEKEELSLIASKKITSKMVIISKDYEGNFDFELPEQTDIFPDKLHPNDVDEICKNLHEPQNPVADEFSDVAIECIKKVKRFSKEGKYSELSLLSEKHNERLRSAMTPGNPQPQHQNESNYISEYLNHLSEIENAIQNEPTIRKKAHDFIVSRIPTFIYMDDYREFQGKANLKILQSKDDDDLTPDEETFFMILNLSGLDFDKLVEQGNSGDGEIIRERQYDLHDAARSLTNDVASRWGTTEYKIEFRCDGQKFFTEIEEAVKNIGMIPLEEQSKGFRWFFSFDLRFMHDSEGTFEGCVLLLDEPGLHLHPGAQQDLLKRLDAYAEKNTLIYTTHLPFLIDLREPSRIRVIKETNNGAIVSDDLGESGPEEKLTLQAALGMTMSQSYLVAQRNLVVEGVDDFMILTELSNLFQRSGSSGFPDDIQLTAAGGASEVVYMATFMVGQNLEVVALFDSDKEGRTQEEKLRTKWLIRYKNVKASTALLGKMVGLDDNENFALEDLFPEEYYLKKFKESHKKKMQMAGVDKISLTGKGLLCEKVKRACEKSNILYNKGSVAKLIRKDIVKMNNIDKLPQETMDKAKDLFNNFKQLF